MKKLKKKRERRYGFSLLNKISHVLRNYFVYLIYYTLLSHMWVPCTILTYKIHFYEREVYNTLGVLNNFTYILRFNYPQNDYLDFEF